MVLASLRVCLGLGATSDLPSHSTASRDAVEQSRGPRISGGRDEIWRRVPRRPFDDVNEKGTIGETGGCTAINHKEERRETYPCMRD